MNQDIGLSGTFKLIGVFDNELKKLGRTLSLVSFFIFVSFFFVTASLQKNGKNPKMYVLNPCNFNSLKNAEEVNYYQLNSVSQIQNSLFSNTNSAAFKLFTKFREWFDEDGDDFFSQQVPQSAAVPPVQQIQTLPQQVPQSAAVPQVQQMQMHSQQQPQRQTVQQPNRFQNQQNQPATSSEIEEISDDDEHISNSTNSFVGTQISQQQLSSHISNPSQSSVNGSIESGEGMRQIQPQRVFVVQQPNSQHVNGNSSLPSIFNLPNSIQNQQLLNPNSNNNFSFPPMQSNPNNGSYYQPTGSNNSTLGSLCSFLSNPNNTFGNPNNTFGNANNNLGNPNNTFANANNFGNPNNAFGYSNNAFGNPTFQQAANSGNPQTSYQQHRQDRQNGILPYPTSHHPYDNGSHNGNHNANHNPNPIQNQIQNQNPNPNPNVNVTIPRRIGDRRNPNQINSQ